MGRQRSVGVEDVRTAVSEIEAEGKAAGIVSVMSRIGGSYGVVKDLLDTVRKERRESLGTALEGIIIEEDDQGIPAPLRPIVDGLAGAWRAMVASERERADVAIVGAQQASDRRVLEAERRLASVQLALEATETQLVDAVERAESAERKAVKAEARSQKLALEVATLQGTLDALPQAAPAPTAAKRKAKSPSSQDASSPENSSLGLE